jgi:hypothetical protein
LGTAALFYHSFCLLLFFITPFTCSETIYFERLAPDDPLLAQQTAQESTEKNLSATIFVELLSSSQSHWELMLELLRVGSSISSSVWSLMSKLPINDTMMRTLRELCVRESDGVTICWNKLLPNDSIYLLLYQLRIINEIITVKQDEVCWQIFQLSVFAALCLTRKMKMRGRENMEMEGVL